MDYSGAVLISVCDKTGVENVASAFVERGAEIYSTGGTSAYLRDYNIPVTDVSAVTSFPEILDGRVKTLHPRIFGGILADRTQAEHTEQLEEHEIQPVIAVIVNFYPFKDAAADPQNTSQEVMENIDIGGPAMLRAAAKNCAHVLPVCLPRQYPVACSAIEEGTVDDLRVPFARDAFIYTMEYEQHIAHYFSGQVIAEGERGDGFKNLQSINLRQALPLRYGENPHQQAAYYERLEAEPFRIRDRQLQGKPLSYNNLLDLDAAIRIIAEFEEQACVIIKHTNPCGFALGENPEAAYRRAVTTDPLSYFGGIVGFNNTVTEPAARALTESFLECIIAPDYTDEALEVLRSKKNLRVLRCTPDNLSDPGYEVRAALSGFLLQERDPIIGEKMESKVVTRRQPTTEEQQAFSLGWRLVKQTRSNAIVLTNDEQALGVGAGQMSRVDAVKIGVRKAREAGLSLEGASMASDAFFPFPDNIEVAAEAGIRSVIQPGGSIRDDQVITAADKLDVAMVFTGQRHFKH